MYQLALSSAACVFVEVPDRLQAHMHDWNCVVAQAGM